MTKAHPLLVLIFVAASAGTVAAQTIGYSEAIDRLAVACGKDIQAYCKGVNLGGGRIQKCLNANQAKVSAQCKTGFAAAFALLERRATAQASVVGICDIDIRKFCGSIQPGDGQILDCILKAERNVSPACNQAVIDAGYR
jgi:hypothetical protein